MGGGASVTKIRGGELHLSFTKNNFDVGVHYIYSFEKCIQLLPYKKLNPFSNLVGVNTQLKCPFEPKYGQFLFCMKLLQKWKKSAPL